MFNTIYLKCMYSVSFEIVNWDFLNSIQSVMLNCTRILVVFQLG